MVFRSSKMNAIHLEGAAQAFPTSKVNAVHHGDECLEMSADGREAGWARRWGLVSAYGY